MLLLSSLPSPEAAPTVQPLGPSPWQALADGGETPRVQEVARDSKDQRVCGKPKAVGKVYGGQDAEAGQWPWQASLLYRGSHLCGAVLIDSHWLVSTAHCFRKSPSSFLLNSSSESPVPCVCPPDTHCPEDTATC
ncbi:Putative serine protease 47 [Fukomys damarensis]|uniref:Putative serine protease 47 n=1 Tax=Fukomys damarensis TaxID=885580 RepID=A0A091EJZ0_FUKDA|nr:Putative serine protease 47 [Fukomys damarensis]